MYKNFATAFLDFQYVDVRLLFACRISLTLGDFRQMCERSMENISSRTVRFQRLYCLIRAGIYALVNLPFPIRIQYIWMF